MHLREYVRADDVDLAIRMMLESFLQSQKYTVAKGLERKFSKYLTAQNDTTQLLLSILKRLVKVEVIHCF